MRVVTLPEIRFQRFCRPQPDGCVLWAGSKNSKGYGVFQRGGGNGTVLAHRFAYEAANGATKGLHVCHKCDVPACVNAAHLFLGTQADNMRDKVAKGRQRVGVGERHGKAKMTTESALEAKRRRARGEKVKDLAAEYGVSVTSMSDMLNGRKWKHLCTE